MSRLPWDAEPQSVWEQKVQCGHCGHVFTAELLDTGSVIVDNDLSKVIGNDQGDDTLHDCHCPQCGEQLCDDYKEV